MGGAGARRDLVARAGRALGLVRARGAPPLPPRRQPREDGGRGGLLAVGVGAGGGAQVAVVG